MIDLKVDDDFDLVLDDFNDLDLVEKNDEIRQRLILTLTMYEIQVIGNKNNPNTLRKLRRKIKQAMSTYPDVDSIGEIDVTKRDSESIDVYVTYNDGEIFNETF